jgi:hypothetical protein
MASGGDGVGATPMIKKASKQAGNEGNEGNTSKTKQNERPPKKASQLHVRVTSVFGGSPAGSEGSDPLDLSLSPQQWALKTMA